MAYPDFKKDLKMAFGPLGVNSICTLMGRNNVVTFLNNFKNWPCLVEGHISEYQKIPPHDTSECH
jgi:hypothetical protein